MSDVIRLLPDSVANQIAAGEVIQRPASVVKELVENAVDAGATEINIYIKDAGRTLIQVIDNGKGMSETDARLAFERHATSKITSADDLFSLSTMGFRGEALPSICAISQVEIKTQRAEDKMGTRILISGSKVEQQERMLCSKGCNIMVKNIFYNVPARRKFLKSDTVELSNIMREFERLALVNYGIRMTIDTGAKTYDLRPATFKQRIADIWKNNLNMQLVPIDIDISFAKIVGFLSKPEFARRRNPLQYLIVNGRNMRHPGFHKAIMSAYEGLIATDTQPCYFIRFEVDPRSIDVNIHPTKNEIKFENENEIWKVLNLQVKMTLGRNAATPQIDFTSEPMPFDPARSGDFVKAPTINVDTTYNPFKAAAVPTMQSGGSRGGGGGRGISEAYRPTKIDRNWDTLYQTYLNAVKGEATDAADKQPDNLIIEKEVKQDALMDDSMVAPLSIQLFDKFLVTPSHEGMMIIDQYRAHVKILYEQYIRKISVGQQASQRLMFPEVLTLDATQQLVLEDIEDELSRMGFLIEYDEENRWNILGVPLMVDKINPVDIILQTIDVMRDGTHDEVDHSLAKQVALIMAKSAAIKGGQVLNSGEMEHLIAELFSLPDPMYTPSGKPIYKVISEDKIRALFV